MCSADSPKPRFSVMVWILRQGTHLHSLTKELPSLATQTKPNNSDDPRGTQDWLRLTFGVLLKFAFHIYHSPSPFLVPGMWTSHSCHTVKIMATRLTMNNQRSFIWWNTTQPQTWDKEVSKANGMHYRGPPITHSVLSFVHMWSRLNHREQGEKGAQAYT